MLATWSIAALVYPSPVIHDQVVSLFREEVDFQVYFSNLGWVKHGEVLLNHGYAEYPVLGLMYVNWPHYLVSGFEAYHWLLWISNAGLLLLAVWLWRRIAELLELPPGAWWLWLLPSSLYYTLNRFDIFPVCLVLLGLYLVLRQRFRSAWVVYGLSIMAKVYPIFLLPLFIQLTRQRVTAWWKYLPYLAAPVVGLLLGVYWVGGLPAVVVPFTLQLARGVDVGSLRAVLIQLGLGSSAWSVVAQVGQVALPAWWLVRVVVGKSPLPSRAGLTLAALSLLLLTNLYPFYSNQWWLWVLPFVAWVLPPPQRVVALFYDLVNYLQFPLGFELLGAQSTWFSLVVAWRVGLAAWLLVVLWRQLPRRWWVVT